MGTLCYRSLAWLPTAATFREFCVFAPSIGFEQCLLEQKTWIITVFWFFCLGGACGPACPFFLLEFMITTLLLYETSFTLTAEQIGFCEPEDRVTCGSLAVSVGIRCPELISSLPLWDPVLVLCVCNAFSPDRSVLFSTKFLWRLKFLPFGITFWRCFQNVPLLWLEVSLSDSDLQSPSREQILKPEGFLKSQGTSSRRTVNTWGGGWEPKGVTGIQ